jgi:hypothetical protein
MLATEFALKGALVRVNAIAPGVYASEMTFDEIKPEQVNLIGKGVQPVPAGRAGTCVPPSFLRAINNHTSQWARDGRDGHLPCQSCGVLHERPGEFWLASLVLCWLKSVIGNCYRWGIRFSQPYALICIESIIILHSTSTLLRLILDASES